MGDKNFVLAIRLDAMTGRITIATSGEEVGLLPRTRLVSVIPSPRCDRCGDTLRGSNRETPNRSTAWRQLHARREAPRVRRSQSTLATFGPTVAGTSCSTSSLSKRTPPLVSRGGATTRSAVAPLFSVCPMVLTFSDDSSCEFSHNPRNNPHHRCDPRLHPCTPFAN